MTVSGYFLTNTNLNVDWEDARDLETRPRVWAVPTAIHIAAHSTTGGVCRPGIAYLSANSQSAVQEKADWSNSGSNYVALLIRIPGP